jgi:hypothetical protein
MLYNNDYVGIQLTKAKLDDLRREAERLHRVEEALKEQQQQGQVKPILQRIRLPKITITWN